jgi:L-methionine (R)-S-oxide reductase
MRAIKHVIERGCFMFKLEKINKMSEKRRLEYLLFLADGLLSAKEDPIANLSNASALINAVLDRLNWVGFYLIKNGQLVLGPFHGLPACNRITTVF